MFRTALLILSGNAAASLLLLLRNLVVARLIPVEDYGVAATFAVVMAMVEMSSAFGLQQQIIQSKDGDEPRFQAALQGFQVMRGVAAGVVLFLIAGPIARFLGIPEVIWAYQLLALVPVVKAFEHFDIHRFNRQMKFWPMILTSGVPALLSLLMIWPLDMWFGDWRVSLYAILTQIGITAITSHLVAERPYWLVFDRAIIGGSLRFGWPILVNAILLFLVFQGDKLIVGRLLGMEALALFAMGMTLALSPTLVIAKSVQNFFLPQLSTSVDSPFFPQIAHRTLQTVTSAALIFLLTISLFGGPFLHIALGEKYASLVPIFIWFAIGQTLRLVKVGPAIVALSLGYTSNAMIANTLRVFVLPATWIVATTTGSLYHVLWLAILGEAFGVVLALTLLVYKSNLNAALIFRTQLSGALAVIALAARILLYPPVEVWPSLMECVVTILIIGVFIMQMLGVSSLRKTKH